MAASAPSNNDGDIIAQWDVVAHRWLLTQNVFTGNYGVCVAISTSPDATGTYYLYEFPVVANGFPDYPKWGVWTNNYGETWNNFGPGGGGFRGPVFCAYNRTKMLTGDQTAEQICHQYTASEDSLLPADRDSPTAPPAGQDQFAIGSVGDVDNSHLSLYSVHINNINDWTQGATFTGDGNSQLLSVATYDPSCNGAYGGDCVPQKGITDMADSLGDRLMYRFAYWEDQPLDQRRGDSADAVACATLAGEFRCDRFGRPDRRALDGNRSPDPHGYGFWSQRVPAGNLLSRWQLALDGFTG